MEGVNNIVMLSKMSSKDTIEIQIVEIFLVYLIGSKPIEKNEKGYSYFLERMIL